MSVTYAACMVVGAPYDELNLSMDEIEEFGLEVFRPYYDAADKDSLVGLAVQCSPVYGYVAAPEKYKFDESISIAFAKFIALTGNVGKFYLTVHSD